MKCHSCGREVSNEYAYCPYCGAELKYKVSKERTKRLIILHDKISEIRLRLFFDSIILLYLLASMFGVIFIIIGANLLFVFAFYMLLILLSATAYLINSSKYRELKQELERS